jgi:putative CRISPR-associated protein (TIGR02619 family)
MVGTSALTNKDIGRAPNNRDNRALSKDVDAFLVAPNQTAPMWTRLRRRLEEAHEDFWTSSTQSLSLNEIYQTSAELTSTQALQQVLAKEFQLNLAELRKRLRVVLLASDTDEGELAAHINRTVMQNVWKLPLVATVRVVGLSKVSAANPHGELTTLLKTHFDKNPDATTVFNITGGFKGAVVQVVLTAAGKQNAYVFYQHESTNAQVVLQSLSPQGQTVVRELSATERRPDVGE